MSKARFQYEDTLRLNSRDYDAWFDYIRLEARALGVGMRCAR